MGEPTDSGTATEHPAVRRCDDGVVVTVHVQPSARRSEVVGMHGDAIKIKVSAPPVDGRANAAVEALVAELFGRRAADANLVAGAGNRRKQVLVRGIAVADATAAIARTLGER